MKKVLIISLTIISCLFLVGCEDKEHREDVFKEISYVIPSVFEKDEDYTYSRYYNFKDDNIYCYVSIQSYEKKYYDEDREIWFKDQIRVTLNDRVSELEKNDIQNNNALFIEVEKSDNKTFDYYYGFVSSNYYYLVDYNIDSYNREENKDIKDSSCYSYRDEIIHSIRLK